LALEPDCGLYVGFWTLFEAGLLPVVMPLKSPYATKS